MSGDVRPTVGSIAGVLVEVREPGRLPLRLVVTDRLPIGRAGEGLLLADQSLSRHHCELRLGASGLVVRDLGSSNGTTVNGRPLTTEVPVTAGDVVGLGECTVLVDPDAIPADDLALTATVVGATAPPRPPVPPRPAVPVDGDPTARHVVVDDLHGSIALVAAGVLADAAGPTTTGDLRASVVGGTVTMVFSDIVDSTALTHRLGDARWIEVLRTHDEVLRSQVTRYHGTEVKSVGDGFLLTFPSARHALLCCISVQRLLAARRSEAFPVHVRMGVHTGEAVREGADLFGGHVNYAARVSSQAGADEIVASTLSHQLAAPMGDVTFEAPRFVGLKGFPGEHAVHPVRWA